MSIPSGENCFDYIPNEMIWCICSSLTPEDNLKFGMTNRRLRANATNVALRQLIDKVRSFVENFERVKEVSKVSVLGKDRELGVAGMFWVPFYKQIEHFESIEPELKESLKLLEIASKILNENCDELISEANATLEFRADIRKYCS